MSSKQKGSRGERLAAKVLSKWSGLEFTRTPSSGGLRWEKTENIAGDIICTSKDIEFPFSVEVKNRSKSTLDFQAPLLDLNSSILDFWDQALEDAQRCDKVPILMMRRDRMPKNTFFIVFEKSFIKDLLPRLNRYIHLKKDEYSLVVINSEYFFNRVSYEEVRYLAG